VPAAAAAAGSPAELPHPAAAKAMVAATSDALTLLARLCMSPLFRYGPVVFVLKSIDMNLARATQAWRQRGRGCDEASWPADRCAAVKRAAGDGARATVSKQGECRCLIAARVRRNPLLPKDLTPEATVPPIWPKT